MKKLILASSSPQRKFLLERLQLDFAIVAPEIDETPAVNESAADLVKRLAITKAKTIASQNPDAVVIGCDQVGAMEQLIFGKPHTYDNAVQQLLKVSGKQIDFFTGLCVVHDTQIIQHTELFSVKFKTLTPALIDYYLEREQPYQCAGSFQAEGLGIILVDKFIGSDFAALVGLPLIALAKIFQQINYALPR